MKRVAIVLCVALVLPLGTPGPVMAVPTQPTSSEFPITLSDLAFILKQIQISEAHATREGSSGNVIAGTSVLGSGPNDVPDPSLPWGLRQVDGRNNNLGAGKGNFGAADEPFPRLVKDPYWRIATDGGTYDPAGTRLQCTAFGQNIPSCRTDEHPRWVSNLIVDQSEYTPKSGSTPSSGNEAAKLAAGNNLGDTGSAGLGGKSLKILNTSPLGLAGRAYNSLFTFFGQFFDHGLDLVEKSNSDVVNLTLPAGDVLSGKGSMLLSRATQPNDTTKAGINHTTPWIDQNQTYASHPSKQVFIREYSMVNSKPVSTGRLLTGPVGEIGTWALVKDKANTQLNFTLVDTDVFNVPLLATDEFGRFLRSANGYLQMVQTDGTNRRLRECTPTAKCSTAAEDSWNSIATGHAFLDDIAHAASPGHGPYDAALLGAHFVTGDGRGNENIGLTAIHTVFHSEHNRVWDDIQTQIGALSSSSSLKAGFTSTAGWGYGERLFQASKFIMEMQYQHLVFDTFARRLEPAIHVFAGYDPTTYPDVTAEFASAVYRFGHSMLNETVARTKADGTPDSASLFSSFLNPTAFLTGYANAETAAGSIARGTVYQAGNEIDEFVTGALRNNLVGIPLDLAALNLARGRDVGLPTLNKMREALYAATGSTSLQPYTSWADFGRRMKYRQANGFGASLVNFIAAYGTDSTITSATTIDGKREAAAALVADPTGAFMTGSAATTGLDAVDLWVGGLAETRGTAGGLLGSTFSYIFRTQMEDLQDGDRFYYLHRLAGLNLLPVLEGNTLADLFIRNTDARNLPNDFFSVVDRVVDLSKALEPGVTNVSGTITYTGNENVVFVGRESVTDKMRGDNGLDTIRGFSGNDWMDGDEGSDTLYGGTGNDVIMDTGLSGVDLAFGGSGDDYFSTGPGVDLNDGGDGNDFFVLGPDGPVANGGKGNDLFLGGPGGDPIAGDEGDDWIDGRSGADNLIGDLAPPPLGVDLINYGNDVLVGGLGSDIMNGSGGDDILVAGDSGTTTTPDTLIGGVGFDWAIYTGTKIVNVDLALAVRLPGDLTQLVMDIFPDTDVEAVSGGSGNDTIRGDARTTLVGVGISDALQVSSRGLISGLSSLLYTAVAGVGDGTRGNILFGGAGSDIIEGRAGNDLIDGDAFITVSLQQQCSGTPTATISQIAALIEAGTLTGACTASNVSIVRTANAGTPNVVGEVDVAVFSGLASQYSITCLVRATPGDATTACVLFRVTGPDGDDVVRNIELLRFADRDIAPSAALGATVAPTVPLNLVLIPFNNSLRATWTQPASGNGAITYTARAWTSGKGGKAVGVPCTVTGILWCDIIGLANGTTYFVDVTATNSVGTSPATPRVSGVPANVVAPGVPTGVVVAANAGGATVTWVAPVNTGGSTITSYTASAYDASTGGTVVESCVATAALTCSLSTLTNGTTYYVEVFATNVAGNSAPSFPRVSVTPSSDPGPSAPLSVVASPRTGGADVSWTAPLSSGAFGSTVQSYTARAYTTGGVFVALCTPTTLPLACTITGLTNGTTYQVGVVATNSNGVPGVESARVSVTPAAAAAAPGVPRNLTVTGGVGTWTSTWLAPLSDGGSPITSYIIRAWAKPSGGKLIAQCTWTTGVLSCTANAPRGTYYVDIVAVNIAGTSVATTPRVTVVVN